LTRCTIRRTIGALFPNGRYVVSATSAPSRKYGIAVHAVSSIAAIAVRIAGFCLTVIEYLTSALRHAAATAPA
jgi:hypothetical protein